MNFKAIIIISISFLSSCTSSDKININIDLNLIVPGRTAEGFNIGEQIEKGSFIVYESRENNIAEILTLDYFSDLKFDSLIYKENESVIFLNKGIVTAIAGLTIDKRITSDAVLLSKGVDNFILNYGNSGLSIMKRSKHSAYIYKDFGIAVFDDNNDNNIDMYLIFK